MSTQATTTERQTQSMTSKSRTQAGENPVQLNLTDSIATGLPAPGHQMQPADAGAPPSPAAATQEQAERDDFNIDEWVNLDGALTPTATSLEERAAESNRILTCPSAYHQEHGSAGQPHDTAAILPASTPVQATAALSGADETPVDLVPKSQEHTSEGQRGDVPSSQAAVTAEPGDAAQHDTGEVSTTRITCDGKRTSIPDLQEAAAPDSAGVRQPCAASSTASQPIDTAQSGVGEIAADPVSLVPCEEVAGSQCQVTEGLATPNADPGETLESSGIHGAPAGSCVTTSASHDTGRPDGEGIAASPMSTVWEQVDACEVGPFDTAATTSEQVSAIDFSATAVESVQEQSSACPSPPKSPMVNMGKRITTPPSGFGIQTATSQVAQKLSGILSDKAESPTEPTPNSSRAPASTAPSRFEVPPNQLLPTPATASINEAMLTSKDVLDDIRHGSWPMQSLSGFRLNEGNLEVFVQWTSVTLTDTEALNDIWDSGKHYVTARGTVRVSWPNSWEPHNVVVKTDGFRTILDAFRSLRSAEGRLARCKDKLESKGESFVRPKRMLCFEEDDWDRLIKRARTREPSNPDRTRALGRALGKVMEERKKLEAAQGSLRLQICCFNKRQIENGGYVLELD